MNVNKNTRNEKINLHISHYKLLSGKISEDIEEQKVHLTQFSRHQSLKVLTEKLTIFSNQLPKRLSKTKEFKLKKLLREKSLHLKLHILIIHGSKTSTSQ